VYSADVFPEPYDSVCCHLPAYQATRQGNVLFDMATTPLGQSLVCVKNSTWPDSLDMECLICCIDLVEPGACGSELNWSNLYRLFFSTQLGTTRTILSEMNMENSLTLLLPKWGSNPIPSEPQSETPTDWSLYFL
jgi:hypothetical protein